MQKLDKVRDELFNVVCDVNALTLSLEDKAPMITLKYTVDENEKTPTERATYNKTGKKWSVVFTFESDVPQSYTVYKNGVNITSFSATSGDNTLTITQQDAV